MSGRPRLAEKDELLNFVRKEYGLDAAQGHGFKARLSLADLRRLKAYADSKQSSLVRDKVGDPVFHRGERAKVLSLSQGTACSAVGSSHQLFTSLDNPAK